MAGRSVGRIVMVFVAAAAAPASASSQSCTTTLASLALDGSQADGATGLTVMTRDGRYVAFNSSARNLAPDNNQTDDVFLREVDTGKIERVSVGTGGIDGNGPSSYPSMSADARFVVFSSWASTLVPGDTNNVNDVFLRDRLLGVTDLVSRTPAGQPGNGGSYLGAITPDARYVVFLSFAGNLVPGDTNGMRDVFLLDRATGVIERVSVSDTGAEADEAAGGNSGGPLVTGDGRYVVFTTRATNLVSGDTNGVLDIYVRDRLLATTRRLSLGLGGAEPDDDCDVTAMTSDGRYVAFASAATNLVPNDTNNVSDAFVLDVTTGVVERVSVTTGGQEVSLSSWSPVISEDGRFVAFSSAADDLVPSDSNGKRDVFLHDRLAHTTEIVSSGLGAANADCNGVSISGDGGRVSFSSASSQLVANDLNDLSDAFVHECRAGIPYCLGTTAACPCGNHGFLSSGCANALTRGVFLTTIGNASVVNDSLTLVAYELPPSTPVLFLQGLAAFQNGQPFGDGLRCVGGALARLGLRWSDAGHAAYGFAGTDPKLSVVGAVPSGGDFRYYQVWYRSPQPFCTQWTFNLSNGSFVLWSP